MCVCIFVNIYSQCKEFRAVFNIGILLKITRYLLKRSSFLFIVLTNDNAIYFPIGSPETLPPVENNSAADPV